MFRKPSPGTPEGVGSPWLLAPMARPACPKRTPGAPAAGTAWPAARRAGGRGGQRPSTLRGKGRRSSRLRSPDAGIGGALSSVSLCSPGPSPHRSRRPPRSRVAETTAVTVRLSPPCGYTHSFLRPPASHPLPPPTTTHTGPRTPRGPTLSGGREGVGTATSEVRAA